MMTERTEGADAARTTLPWWRQIYNSTAEDPRFDWIFMAALLVTEAVLGHIIILKVPYTEIDWIAYVEEVDTFESGERDYLLIRGGTGPLVYPAGFLYLFSYLKHCTENGTDVRTAQYIFLGFYLLTQAVVLEIYRHCLRSSSPSSPHQVWMWRCAMGCLCLSKRIHSIFMLRLFNDGPTMLLLYLSILFFNKRQWNLGCVIFSLAVSIKMNVLLFAPGLLLLLLQSSGSLSEVVYRLGFCCALPQLVLGAPFLMTFPVSYLRKAFELDRVFFFKWTVNWKFLPEDIFTSKPLSVLLLVLHLGFLVWFLCIRWKPARLLLQRSQLSPAYITTTLMVSNYIGICFARTLHYQFYAWYFHSLPFLLLMNGRYPIWLCLGLLVAVEIAFLTFPATPWSSALLQVAHMGILAGIRPPPIIMEEGRKTE